MPANIASKRAHFQKVAREHPGRLLQTGLESMAAQLGTLEGAEFNEPAPSLVLRWFLTVFVAQHPNKSLGEPLYREMRTIATVLDKILVGDVPSACDYLMQRFKGLQLFVNDGSWESARFLELIPQTTGQSAATYSELELAHSISVAELKIQKLRSELSR